MTFTLLSKRSSVPGKAPTTAQLSIGQFAINTNDGLIYFVQNSGTATVVAIGPVPQTANAMTTTTTLALSGDITGSASFNGSSNVSIAASLASTGVTAGTYNTFVVNSKGLITSASNAFYQTTASGTFVPTVGSTTMTGTLTVSGALTISGYSGVASQALYVTGAFLSTSSVTAYAPAGSNSTVAIDISANPLTTIGSSLNLSANTVSGVTAIQFLTNSVMRWQVGTDTSTNANLQMASYLDNGTLFETPLTITRANATVNITTSLASSNAAFSALTIPGATVAISGATTGSTSFVGNALSIATTIPTTGVSAGTYNTFSVTSTGQINAASNYIVTALTGDTTFYINNTTGSDTNSGLTTSSPFKTIQGAWYNILGGYDMAGHTITLQCANGTYAGATMVGMPAGYGVTTSGTQNSILLVGNTTSVSSCVISSTYNCLSVANNAVINLKGFSFASSSGHGLFAQSGGVINVLPVTNSTTTSVIFGAITQAQMYAYAGGYISAVNVGYTINGGGIFHAITQASGNIYCGGCNVTLTGTPVFQYFIVAQLNASLSYTTSTFTGSCTTSLQRYTANFLGTIYTGTSGNISYFPGSTTGVTAYGGVYQ